MISALWNGVSGLNTYEKALDTQSNNVSNSGTIGHKKDEISFQDLMYQSRYGKGVTVQGVEKNFNQGGIKVTNNTLDVAIEGDGFFMVQDPKDNEQYFTRAGNFKMGTNGVLQSMENNYVLGTPTTISNIVSSDPNVQQFTSDYTSFIDSRQITTTTFAQSINAKSTDYTKSAVDSGVSGSGFKTANSKMSDIEALITDYKEKMDLYASNPVSPGSSSTSQVTQIDFIDFNIQLQGSGDYIELSVNNSRVRQYFDTDTQTTMNEFADKISAVQGLTGTVDSNGLVTINTLIPGSDFKITTPAINDRGYGVVETTAPILGSGLGMINSSRDALKDALENADAKLLEMTNHITYLDPGVQNIQNSVSSIQLKLDSLNISENVFGQLSIEDGIIYAKDDDNKFLVGKLETAQFPNSESLVAVGGTNYSIGKETGVARNADSINKLVSKSIELSNTEFSESLVDLMVYQRAFEANSKSVTTSDEFLRTALELKK